MDTYVLLEIIENTDRQIDKLVELSKISPTQIQVRAIDEVIARLSEACIELMNLYKSTR